MIMSEDIPVVKSWRLGTDLDPGWFDISDLLQLDTGFFMGTVFQLQWRLDDLKQDAIHDILHGITLGWRHQRTKIHIEHIAQILGGKPHITARITDLGGRVHRTTQPLPEDNILTHRLLLLYSGRYQKGILSTSSLLKDLDSGNTVQINTYQNKIAADQIEFARWPGSTVICDHEQHGMPCDHVMVGGHARCAMQTPFRVFGVCGMIGHDLAVEDPTLYVEMCAESIPHVDSSGGIWYCANAVQFSEHLCQRYNHPKRLGMILDLA